MSFKNKSQEFNKWLYKPLDKVKDRTVREA